MENAIYTRQDYFDGNRTNPDESYKRYYRQFATPLIRSCARTFLERAKKSTDEYLNDIPIEEWDSFEDLIKGDIAIVNKKIGEGHCYSNSDCVSALKETVRLLIEEESQK